MFTCVSGKADNVSDKIYHTLVRLVHRKEWCTTKANMIYAIERDTGENKEKEE